MSTQMQWMPAQLAGAVALSAICASAAGNTESWSFDLMTTGDDVFWASPTNVDNEAPRYHGAYEITLVEVTVTWIGIPFGPIDVTDEIPEEDRSGEEIEDGPPPIVLLDDSLVYPEPPEEPSLAANVFIELDTDGFGQLAITDVTLGTAVVDLGGFIGEQTVNITSVRVVGTMDVTPLGPLGDLNGDGVVDVFDLILLINDWGPCDDPTPGNCPADLNEDGIVDVFDLILLINNWG